MDELKRAGVECQAIPGISSALAALHMRVSP